MIGECPVHLIQMWVVPDEGGITPGYELLEIEPELLAGQSFTVASGMDAHRDNAAIRIKNRYAALPSPSARLLGHGRTCQPLLRRARRFPARGCFCPGSH